MVEFVTPVGRLIYGDVFKGSDKGFKNRLNEVDKSTGLPAIKWAWGIAVEKNNPELPAFMQLLQNEMRTAWPNFRGNMSDNAQFSAKIEDGDKKTPAKEGYTGCVIFKIGSNYLPTVFAPDLQRIITNPEEVKRGYYVQIAGQYSTNGQDDKPGMKMWGGKVVFRYKGEEIKGSGGDASCFQNTGGYKPPGATDANSVQGLGGQQQGNPNQPVNAQTQAAQPQQSTGQNGASGVTTSHSNEQQPAQQDWDFLNQ